MKTKTLICSTCGTPYTPGDPDWDDTERIPVHMDWGMVGQMSEPRVCGSGVEAGAEPTVSAAMDLIRTRILVDSPCDRWADLGPKIRGAVEVVEAALGQEEALTLERESFIKAKVEVGTWNVIIAAALFFPRGKTHKEGSSGGVQTAARSRLSKC